ncbi:MAG: flagellar biosynthesis protein FlaG, partial [Pyrodictiaceae archaeon]
LATSSPASEPALQERIKIVAVAKNATSVTVYVQNLGAVPVKVSAVYIIAANGTLLCSNTTPTDNTTISPSTIGEIVVDSNCANVLSIGTYTVKVVTGRGTEAYYTLTIAAS